MDKLFEPRESNVEDYFVASAKRHGGLAIKWGRDGLPDRVYIHPTGEVWFVELKRRGRKLADLQDWWFKQFQAVKANTIVLDTKPKIDQFFASLK